MHNVHSINTEGASLAKAAPPKPGRDSKRVVERLKASRRAGFESLSPRSHILFVNNKTRRIFRRKMDGKPVRASVQPHRASELMRETNLKV